VKTLAACVIAVCTLAPTLPALAADGAPFSYSLDSESSILDRNPIIYNLAGNEVGVIRGMTDRDGLKAFIVLPTQATLDLGYYRVAIPASALQPRRRGGWTTSLNNCKIAYLQPYTQSGKPRFFWSSGD
jgi:hypothetical protein